MRTEKSCSKEIKNENGKSTIEDAKNGPDSRRSPLQNGVGSLNVKCLGDGVRDASKKWRNLKKIRGRDFFPAS